MAEAAREAGLDDDVVDLLADAARADGTYRVAYDLEGQQLVVTQRPPDRRIDTVAEDGTVDAVVTVAGTTHACTRPANAEWRCEELGRAPDEGVFTPDAVAELAGALASSAGDYDLSIEERTVAGAVARCLVAQPSTPAAGAEGTFCIADSGAVLLVERPAGTIRATEYASEVEADAFELPAS